MPKYENYTEIRQCNVEGTAVNPGQLGLGSSRPESTRPGQLGRVNSACSFFLPLRLNPRGGRQTGIPVYQVLKGVS